MAEFGRRIVHASGGVVPLAYVLDVATWPQVQAFAVVAAAVAVALEVLRLYVGLEWRVYETLTREYEQDNPAGYALYMLSTAAVVLAFPPQVAVPAVLMLTWGDPVSGLVGSGELRRVARPRVLVTMFAVCTLIAVPFVGPAVAVVGGLAATVADGVKPVVRGYVVDDNLTIPPAAALAMAAGLSLLPPGV